MPQSHRGSIQVICSSFDCLKNLHFGWKGKFLTQLISRNRLRQYPALINCTTIDWFMEWPKEALLEVADRYLKGVDLMVSITGAPVGRVVRLTFICVMDKCLLLPI